MVRRTLTSAGRDDLLDAAELLVSELVTNALLHAGTPIDVAAIVERDRIRVEVGDQSPHLPARRHYGTTAGTGRGLRLLEQMADDWGVRPVPVGKRVWFDLGARSDEPAYGHVSGSGEAGVEGSDTGTHVVQLLEVPLLLHAAWQEHAETLLREYLLASIDEASEEPILLHAEAGDALALLAEQIPTPTLPTDGDQVLVEAVEPHVTEPQVDLVVPVQSLTSFRTLDAMLGAALEMAENGLLLTPPTQPEMRTLRMWLCREVLTQTNGDRPTPWSAQRIATVRADAPEWDSAPALRSTSAVVVADDRNRILAVNEAVLRLLGYDDDSALVGERLVVLMPERYRQAHLAGMTFHLLDGRGALLNRAVVVPALRRDGTECPVELTVEAHAAAAGRSVFVGTLVPVD